MRKVAFILFGLSLMLRTAFACAADSSTKPPREPPPWVAEMQTITKEFQSNEPAQLTTAVSAMNAWLAPHRAPGDAVHGAVMEFKDKWGPRLIALKRYDDLEQGAVNAILVNPSDLSVVETIQKLRIKAFHAAGKEELSLGAARAYYNVSYLNHTSDAISIVSTALAHARADDPEIVRRFRAEQVAGATTQPAAANAANPATHPAAGTQPSGVLASIKVDDAPFKDAIAEMDSWEFKDVFKKANLLLISGRSHEALELMRKAYEMADARPDVNSSTEGVARAMRAEDGSVGRANAWLTALREGEAGK